MAGMRLSTRCSPVNSARIPASPLVGLHTTGHCAQPRSTACHASNPGEQRTYTDEEVEAVLGLPADYVWPYTGPDIEHLQETFNQLPYITVHEGPHDYPVVFIQHPNGADITLHLHGGFISSWVDVDQELLFIHPGTDFKPSRSLTGGGVRPCFPQHGFGVSGMPDRSTLPLNGFLSSQHFDLLATCVQDPTKDDPEPTVSLLLESNSETRAVFPHDFVLAYHVTLMNADDEEWRSLKKLKSEDEIEDAKEAEEIAAEKAAAEEAAAAGEEPEGGIKSKAGGKSVQRQRIQRPSIMPVAPKERGRKKAVEEEPENPRANDPTQIRFVWEVSNTGTDAFEFQASTLSDIATKDLTLHAQSVRLTGLKDRYALDWSSGDPATPEILQEDMDFTYPVTPVGTSLDRVYCGTDFGDVHFCPGDFSYYKVVFRSGFRDTIVSHPDLGEADWHAGFVTVGAGAVAAPINLQPGEQWCAEYSLRRHRTYWDLPDFEVDGTPLPEQLNTPNVLRVG